MFVAFVPDFATRKHSLGVHHKSCSACRIEALAEVALALAIRLYRSSSVASHRGSDLGVSVGGGSRARNRVEPQIVPKDDPTDVGEVYIPDPCRIPPGSTDWPRTSPGWAPDRPQIGPSATLDLDRHPPSLGRSGPSLAHCLPNLGYFEHVLMSTKFGGF